MELVSIHVYPVKSCAGLAVETAVVTPRGLVGDRRWMIVDEDGRFLTQRVVPRMALIRPRVNGESLILEAEGAGTVTVVPPREGERLEAVVWNDRVDARAAGAEPDAWLAAFLGQRCRLVWMPDDANRPVDRAYGRESDQVSFADGFPFLLTTTASLDDLNSRLAAPVPMNRFRPNLVIAGTTPFEEDEWSEIAFGDVRLRVVKPCARCVITTTDQASGVRGEEPLRTLATFRRQEGKVMFGQNLIPSTTGELRVGMGMHVGRRKVDAAGA